MQREVTVQDGKIVIRVDGVSVRYPLSIVQKRVKELSVELETWQEYERRLLTPLALDACPYCVGKGKEPANDVLVRCRFCGGTGKRQ